MKGCLSLRKGLPLSTTNLEQLKLVICDEERVKFWEAIKEVLTNLEVKVATSSPAPQDPQGVPGQTGQIGPGQGDDTAYAALGGCGLASSRSALTGR